MSSSIREAVLSQMEGKIIAGEALSAAVQAETDARAVLDEARAAVAAARRTALTRGWDERELKKLGLASTARAGRGRKAKASSPSAAAADTDAGASEARHDEDSA